MRDTAPISSGIIAVAGLFGIVAAGVSYVVAGYGFIGALVVGVVVAAIVAVVLLLGWRNEADKPGVDAAAKAAAVNRAGTAPTARTAASAAAPAHAASAPAAAPATAQVAAAPVSAAPAPATATAASPVAKSPAPAAEKPAPKPKAKAAAKPKAKAAPKTKAEPAAAAPAEVVESAPELMTAPRATGADDLQRISGVGPKLEGVLNDLGFWHFDQIAAWTPAQVAWVDARLKFKGRIERDDWIGQATAFAKDSNA